MDSLIVSPLTYALELEEGKYYVGITYNLNLRVAQHYCGSGSKWTRLYKPKRIINVMVGNRERDTTLELMREKGWQNVRGGPWCKADLKHPPKCLDNH